MATISKMINDAYNNAVLADSSYVTGLLPGMTGKDLKEKLNERMTQISAQYIGDNFKVVTQIESSFSSFDAVVWRENNTGKIYVSMRGSQQAMDFLVDADLALTGNAAFQLLDTVGGWMVERA